MRVYIGLQKLSWSGRSCSLQAPLSTKRHCSSDFLPNGTPTRLHHWHIFQANPSSPISDEVLYVENDIFCLLNTIDVTKASGPDGISGYMLKGTAEAITPTVTHLFNLSLKSGKVPEAWKTSSVVPIPKTQTI